MSPQDRVAAEFMKHKGYPNAQPKDIEKLEGHESVWYYLYELTGEWLMELEVAYEDEQWSTCVTNFTSLVREEA